MCVCVCVCVWVPLPCRYYSRPPPMCTIEACIPTPTPALTETSAWNAAWRSTLPSAFNRGGELDGARVRPTRGLFARGKNNQALVTGDVSLFELNYFECVRDCPLQLAFRVEKVNERGSRLLAALLKLPRWSTIIFRRWRKSLWFEIWGYFRRFVNLWTILSTKSQFSTYWRI